MPLDAVDQFGQTAATLGICTGHIESVKLLGNMKADLTLCGLWGTALRFSVKGAGMHYVAAITAIYKGDIERVKSLIDMKADLTLCGQFGTTMHCAIQGGHAKILEVRFYEC